MEGTTRKKILVVDDDDFAQMTVQAMLTSIGREFLTAANGKEGIKQYQKNLKGVECILMDFNMPEMGGIEATKQIRGFEKYVGLRVKIIGLTGDDSEEIIKEAMDVGMDDVVVKPVKKAKLEELFG